MTKIVFAEKAAASRYARKLIVVSCAAVLVSLAAGCAGLVQKGGEVLEGSAFQEKTVALYRTGGGKEPLIELRELKTKSGEGAVEISNSAWPGFVLRGSAPEQGGNIELGEAIIVSSHVQGWNELNLQLLGSAAFRDDPGADNAKTLVINGEAERIQITSGKIRLKASRLTGEAALLPLRNRRERILALTEWMAEEYGATGETASFGKREEFENYWKPIIFPELVSKRKRPAKYAESSGGENVKWGRADSVKWNISYTELLFPEGLWEYRNSGALLRDWEEALSWIYMEYSWDRVIGSLDKISLQRKK